MTLATTTHGASHLRVLRVLRRGDRHDVRDLTVSIRLEGAVRQPSENAQPAGAIPPAPLETFVHAALRAAGGAEIETIGLAICRDLFTCYPHLSRARVEITEQPWTRPDIGGRPQGQCFLFGGAERRMVAVTSNGVLTSVVSGIDDLTLMRTAGFLAVPVSRAENGSDDAAQALIVGSLAARWTYCDPQVTFGPYRRGVRTIIVETFAVHAARSVAHTLQAIGHAIVDAYQEIRDVTLTMAEHPCRPADPMSVPAPDVDDLFIIRNAPLAVVDVHVERQ